MPRNSGWGETEQKNSLNLVEALLSHADEELELDDALKTAVQVEWVSANQLRLTGKEQKTRNNRIVEVEVGTRKEHLVALIKKTGNRLELGKRQGSQQDNELDAIQTVIDRLRDLGVLKEDPNPRKNKGYWKFTLTLQHQTESRDKNLAVVKQKWQEKTASNVPESSPIPDKNIDWRDICDKVVATQQLRRPATAQQYELNIYVPLGLMERPKTPNPRSNPTGEESRQKEPELQIVQTYKDDAFFQKVIAENRTEKGKHIAIIGEPGAGKTTLLGELAERLPKNSPDFPICIRLADLRESTIEDYLLDNWLKKALQYIDADAENVTPEIRKALKQLFCQGKVWLLLDAVDEMAAESPVQALAKIREQLTDWVGKARVVLTCRLNVWDATISNTLTDFETYKTLEFEPDDVDKFIRQWFEEASQDEKRRNTGKESFWHSQGKRLQQQLKESGKERIRELVRNPLRLSMLCQSWCVPEQDLPETKAALYEQFTTYFFEWKQEEFQKKHRVLKETDKKQIQQALAKLALAAMESANRFRIEQEFAIGQMEEQWFDLADKLGWLVLVDRDTRTKKPVYSFLHSSFQEYFAALAVDDWDFFLPRNHIDRPVLGKRYRIFEPQWKEVILLWLGCEDVESDRKEDLINKLVGFNDGCGNFYRYRTYFLAAFGIAEFRNCQLADSVIVQIVKWYFGYFNLKYNNRNQLVFLNPNPVYDRAKQTILETDRTTLLRVLINLLCYSQNEFLFRQAIECLGDFGSGNQEAIQILIDILCKSQNKLICQQAAKSLGRIGAGNLQAKNVLNYLISTGKDEKTRLKAAESLQQLDPEHPESIEFIIDTLLNKWDDFMPQEVIWILKKTTYTQSKAIRYLTNLLHTNQDEKTSRIVSWSLGQLDHCNSDAVKVLNRLLETAHNDYFKLKVAVSLEQTDPGNLNAIAYLSYLSKHAHDNKLQLKAIASLGAISHNNLYVINALIDFLDPNSHIPNLLLAIEMLGWSGYANSDAIAALTCLLYASNNPAIRYTAAVNLGEINPGNLDAINTLIEFLHTSKDEETLLFTVDRLGRIANGNLEVITALDDLLHNNNNERVCWEAAWNLWRLNFCKVDTIYSLTIEQLFSNKMENNSRIAAWRLKEILQERLFFSMVKKLAVGLPISVNNNNYEHYNNYYENALYCAQNMPYPDFYQAWHQDTLPNSATASLNLANLPQLLAEAINNQPNLCSKVKLICIDTHQFIEPENPAPEIYDEMQNQNCPEWQNGYPDTMQKLKLYWNSLRRQSEIPLFFICYDSTALSPTPTGFSTPFLKALSKFDRAICIVCETEDIPLPTFSPSQPDLVAAVLAWIRRGIL